MCCNYNSADALSALDSVWHLFTRNGRNLKLNQTELDFGNLAKLLECFDLTPSRQIASSWSTGHFVNWALETKEMKQ